MPNIIHSLSSAKKKIFLGTVFLLTGTYLLSLLLLNSQNILYKNDFWFPYRANFFAMRAQGIESLLERSMIAREKLRTHHQRVFSRKELVPKSISFKMRYQESSFVDIIFNGNDETYEAIRITNEPWRPSMYFKSKHTGEYVEKSLIDIRSQIYKTLNVTLKDVDGKLHLFINGQDFEVPGQFNEGKIGFDLSEFSVIWDPVIETGDGKMIEAPFALSESVTGYFMKNLLIFIVLFAAIIFFTRNKTLRFFQFTFFFFLLSSFAYVYDNYYYSFKLFRFMAKEFTFRQIRRDYVIDPEDVRYRFFRKWYQTLGGAAPTSQEMKTKRLWPQRFFRARYCDADLNCETIYKQVLPDFSEKTKESLRIMVWGGSLSAGSALLSLEESYPEILQKNLVQHFKGKKRIELLNASRGDLMFNLHFSDIMHDIDRFKPDIVYLDTIPPQDNPEMLGPMYREMSGKVPRVVFQRLPIRYDQYTNVSLDTIRGLVSQGLIPKKGGFFFFRNDFLIQRWVDEMGLIFVDPNNELLTDKVILNGQLFWDPTHLTAYGHRIWGNYLSRHLIQLLESSEK